jgi:hypothetical protein
MVRIHEANFAAAKYEAQLSLAQTVMEKAQSLRDAVHILPSSHRAASRHSCIRNSIRAEKNSTAYPAPIFTGATEFCADQISPKSDNKCARYGYKYVNA